MTYHILKVEKTDDILHFKILEKHSLLAHIFNRRNRIFHIKLSEYSLPYLNYRLIHFLQKEREVR